MEKEPIDLETYNSFVIVLLQKSMIRSIHKDNNPLRPVVSTSGSTTHFLASFFSYLLKHLVADN